MKRIIQFKVLVILYLLFLSHAGSFCQIAVKGYDAQVDSIYYRLDGDNAIVVYDTSFIGGTGRNPSYSKRKNISIPEVITFNGKTYKVNAIGGSAFFNCQELKTISIPSSITTIGANAFSGCSVLDSVVSYITNPGSIDESVFFKSGSHIHNIGTPSGMPSSAVLYVPLGTKSKYESLEGWNSFKTIEEILIDGSIFTAFTEEGAEMEFKIISTSEKTCEVSRLKDYRAEGEITIPSEVNSFQVIAIGESAFGKCSSISSVKIPNSITKIGVLAFSGCSDLSTIKLPSSLAAIGYGAFEDCKNLKSIVIPSSVTTIECLSPTGSWSNPFRNCSSLESIVVETGNTVYDSRDNCNGIITKTSSAATTHEYITLIAGCKNTVIPSSVEIIGDYAFAGMGLTHIDIPSSVGDNIGANAFYGNYIERSKFITHDGLNPANCNYWGCTILDTSTEDGFYISNGKLLKYTGGDTEIVIPDIVTSLSDYVFSGRVDVTSVTIPDNVTAIGYGVFLNCSSLKSVNIPSGVTVVNDNTFNGCTALSAIDLPKSITSIGNFAFSGCCSLETIIFPEGLNSIGSGAFQRCESLTEVYCYRPACPETGNDVFLDSNISKATLWVLETSYDEYKATAPWSDFGSIKTLEVAIVNPSKFTFTATTVEGVQMQFRITDSTTKSAEVYGYYVNRTATLKEYYPAISQNASKVTIPASVITNYGEYNITSISSHAFYHCKLNTLTIPGSINTIRYNAFEGCTSLEKVIIPDIAAWCSVKFELYNNTLFRDNSPLTIGSLYSDENTEITNLVIPDGVTAINDYAFYFCKNLTSVKIPRSVASIGKNAFVGCSSLQKVIAADIAAWCSVSFNDNPLYYAHHLCVEDDVAISEIHIPDGVTHIAPHAFYGCWNITRFVMPDDLQSIGEDALPFPKQTVGTNIKYYNLYYYCNKGTAGLLAVWNYLSQLSKTYDQKVINLQNAYDLQDRGTQLPAPSLSVITTQTTASIKVTGICDGYDYTLNGTPLETDEIERFGLEPGYSQNLTLRVTLPNNAANDVSYTCEAYLNTKGLNPVVSVTSKSASSLSVSGIYSHGDAVVTKETLAICKEMKKSDYPDKSAYCSVYNPNATNRYDYYSNYYLMDGATPVESDKRAFYGLNPSTNYYIVYTVYMDQKAYPSVVGLTTDEIMLTTQAAQAISDRKARISALTNVDDDLLRCGFEWRKYDAPDLVPSTLSPCPVYDGEFAGTLNGLSANAYYKYRSYYKSDAGNMYYGEWSAFGTADAYAYFEPVVHTSEPQIGAGTMVTLSAVVVAGSDDIVEQGFEYWVSESSAGAMRHATQDVQRVLATGQRMTVVLTDLRPEVTYSYRAFVTTAKETTYSEERFFSIDASTGIDMINGDKTDVRQAPFNVYTLSGTLVRRHAETLEGLPRGLYIVNRRKVFVR